MASPTLQHSYLAAGLLLLSACSITPEADYQQRAEQLLSQQFHWQGEQTQAQALTQLTELIDHPLLLALVEQGLAANPSLQQTAIAVKIAMQQRQSSNASRIPQVSAGLSGNKSEDSNSSYSGSLAVSWELDLWQKLSNEVAAADLDIATSTASYQAAKDALAANIMRTGLDLLLQQQLLQNEQQRQALLAQNEQVILQRYRAGLGNLEDLDNARSNTASSKANIASYQESVAAAKRQLETLLGGQTLPAQWQHQATFPQLLNPLVGLPQQDLHRRPDLQQAYYEIQAQQLRAAVAYKQLLPSINLQASLDTLASSPSQALFGSAAWSLLGQITAPLFQGGQLRAQAEIAELTAEQSYWAFQDTLLTAVREVEDALGLERSIALQQEHITQAYDSAKRSANNYEQRYRQGLVDIVDLINVQQQSFDLQAQLLQLTYSQLSNRIDLGLALGLGVSA